MAEAMGWTLKRQQQGAVLALAGGILVLTAFVPLAWLVGEIPSAGPEAFALLTSSRTWTLLLRSLLLSSAVTAVALGIGIPMGILLGRMGVPGRRTLWLVHAFPMFLPPFLPALGWFHLFGRQGLLGTETTAALLFSEIGLVLLLGATFAPVATSLVALAVMGVDATLVEAARVVAGPWRVATRILLPAAWPAIALSIIAIFALSLSELGVPMFLRVDVFPSAVFARLGGIDYAPGEAFMLVLPLLPIALALLWLERRFVGRRSFAVLSLRAGGDPLPLGRWRGVFRSACWLVGLVSVVPIASLVIRAGGHGGGLLPVIEWARQAPWNSLLTAALAATVIAFLGLIIGHGIARRLRGASLLDAIAVLAFVTPASVLGIGLIAAWNHPSTQVLYGGIGILVVGYVARYAVVGVRVVASAVTQSPVHMEEAAASCGAGFIRRLVRIVLPIHARGLAFAWLLAMVFCLRDLETAVLFYPPGLEPLTVRIFTLEANGPEAVVAGLAVAQVAMTAGALAVGALLLPRRPGT